MKSSKVSSTTDVAKLAGYIAGVLRDGDDVELIAIGAGAANQASKGIAVASGYLAQNADILTVRIGFGNTEIGNIERTTLRYVVSKG